MSDILEKPSTDNVVKNMSNQKYTLLIAELLSAKFTHDMAGLVGAVINGLEFIQDPDSNMQHKAFELVNESTNTLKNRLEYARYIYGYTKNEGEVLLSSLRKMCQDFYNIKKINLNWCDQYADGASIELSHDYGRITLHILYILSSGLLSNGKVDIKIEESPKRLVFIGNADKLKFDDKKLEILTNSYQDITPDIHNIQYIFMAMLLEKLGSSISYSLEPNNLTINLNLI